MSLILSNLRHYLEDKRIVSLDDISKQFSSTPEVIGGMLEHWCRKGRIRKLEPQNDCQLPCQACRGCDRMNQVFYQVV